jgi:hypothetical protein
MELSKLELEMLDGTLKFFLHFGKKYKENVEHYEDLQKKIKKELTRRTK